MAYSSFVSGRSEIYVERYPELGNRQLISTGGGDVAVWSRDGRELFFITPDGRPDVCAPGAVRDDARRRASAGVF
jgi:eukaryotic-like serine/threonine-protein kinase